MKKSFEELQSRLCEISEYLSEKEYEINQYVLSQFNENKISDWDECEKEKRKLLYEKVYMPIGMLITSEDKQESWQKFCRNGCDSVSNFLFLLESMKDNQDPNYIFRLVDNHQEYLTNALLQFSKNGQLYCDIINSCIKEKGI